MKKLFLFAAALMFFVAAGCEDNPVQVLIMNQVNASDPNAWTNPWMIYSNGDNMSLGNVNFPTYTDYWKTRQNQLTLQYRFNNVSDGYLPAGQQENSRHHRAAYMFWDGTESAPYLPGGVIGPLQDTYVGWGLTAYGTSSDPRIGKDISAAGYTTIKFAVRGTLRANVTLIVKIDDVEAIRLTAADINSSQWKEFSAPIPVGVNMASIVSLVQFIFEASVSPNNGGEVWLDNIRYER